MRSAARLRPSFWRTLRQATMYRLAYRNFGDHESLVTTFTVDGAASRRSRHEIRRFELRDPPPDPEIYQQGTVRAGRRATASWARSPWTLRQHRARLQQVRRRNPSVARGGGAAGGRHARHAGRGEHLLEGPESLPPVVGFWGHYSSMAVDPSDDCTFWYTGEYIGAPAPFFEYSRIGSFRFPSCTSGPSGVLQGTVTEAGSGNPHPGSARDGWRVGDADRRRGRLPIPDPAGGTYDMTATRFGYVVGSASGASSSPSTDHRCRTSCCPRAEQAVFERRRARRIRRQLAALRAAPDLGSRLHRAPTVFTDPLTGYYIDRPSSAGIVLPRSRSSAVDGQATCSAYVAAPVSACCGRGVRPIVQNIAPDDADLRQRATAPGYRVGPTESPKTSPPATCPPGWSPINDGFDSPWTVVSGPDPCGNYDGNLTGGSGALRDHPTSDLRPTQQRPTASCGPRRSTSRARLPPESSGTTTTTTSTRSPTWTSAPTAGAPGRTSGGARGVDERGPGLQSVDLTALCSGPAERPGAVSLPGLLRLLVAGRRRVPGRARRDLPRAAGRAAWSGTVRDANTGPRRQWRDGASIFRTRGPSPTTVRAPQGEPENAGDGFYILFAAERRPAVRGLPRPVHAPGRERPRGIPGAAAPPGLFASPAGRLTASPNKDARREGSPRQRDPEVPLRFPNPAGGRDAGVRDRRVRRSAARRPPLRLGH